MKIKFGRSEFLLLVLGTGAALTLFLSGCAQQTDSNATTWQQTYDGVLANGGTSTCFNCHFPGGSSQTLVDFSSADTAFSTLVNAQVRGPSNASTCVGVKLVEPGSPEKSYLMGMLFPAYRKRDFAGSANCEPPSTHLSQVPAFTQAEQATFEAWIKSGAAR